MSARIIVNDKVRWQSHDWPRAHRNSAQLRGTYRSDDPEERARLVLPIVDPEYAKRVRADYRWADPKTLVVYKMVEHLDPMQGWCLISQLMKHYGVQQRTVLEWCQVGLIDAAIEHGTPTKRYKPLDNGRLHQLAAEVHERGKIPWGGKRPVGRKPGAKNRPKDTSK